MTRAPGATFESDSTQTPPLGTDEPPVTPPYPLVDARELADSILAHTPLHRWRGVTGR